MMSEDVLGHRLARTDDVAFRAEAFIERLGEAMEELYVLRLLAGEFDIGPNPIVVVHHRLRLAQHERQNELLDQAEDAQIGVSADLIEKPLLARREKIEPF